MLTETVRTHALLIPVHAIGLSIDESLLCSYTLHFAQHLRNPADPLLLRLYGV